MRAEHERRAVTVRGAVQGVGFRPFVHGLARRLGLRGFVKKRTGDVFIEVEGEATAVDLFLRELALEPPPLAGVDEVHSSARPLRGEETFRIESSDTEMADAVVLPPDVATCGRSGQKLQPGDRVKLSPRARADVFDLALAGRSATVVSVEEDFEGLAYVTVTIDDDPGQDLGRTGQPGHRFFFRTEEVEPLS